MDGGVKDIAVRVIPSSVANPFVDAHHYSGKHVQNSQLHLGAFLGGRLHGVMSFGPPMDRRKVIGLVSGTEWNGMVELNRMAFDAALPRNSESRCLSVAMRMLRHNAPQVKWVLSFADACSCGDGTIYRAAGFVLTGIRENHTTYRLPDGAEITDISLRNTRTRPRDELGGRSYCQIGGNMDAYCEATGAVLIPGHMLRYIYFVDRKWRKRLTVPELPYSAIQEAGAGMYKGVRHD